jgi:preprotein translocase subunit Sec63
VLAGFIGFIVIWFLMGLITDKFSTAPAPPPSSSQSRPDWADVLGVAPDASRDEIKRAYLQKIEEF